MSLKNPDAVYTAELFVLLTVKGILIVVSLFVLRCGFKRWYGLCVGRGGGIVFDSDPQLEAEEIRHKAAVLTSI